MPCWGKTREAAIRYLTRGPLSTRNVLIASSYSAETSASRTAGSSCAGTPFLGLRSPGVRPSAAGRGVEPLQNYFHPCRIRPHHQLRDGDGRSMRFAQKRCGLIFIIIAVPVVPMTVVAPVPIPVSVRTIIVVVVVAIVVRI